ncbi:RING/U-box superfamily protein [Euphorbia peplus]|nr:RING/U-box superfamily protein [Euphorbia peplus]
MEQHPPSIFISPDPPPFPGPPRTVDLSPLEFILAILAVVAIPALIYTFFFSIKCPSPFRRRSSDDHAISDNNSATGDNHNDNKSKEMVSDLKYQKETHVKDLGSECPVCLSGFSEGEDVKQLGICKHSFHGECINMWLKSNNNCPVCRATVPGAAAAPAKQRRRDNGASSDFHQGLPDAANMV